MLRQIEDVQAILLLVLLTIFLAFLVIALDLLVVDSMRMRMRNHTFWGCLVISIDIVKLSRLETSQIHAR